MAGVNEIYFKSRVESIVCPVTDKKNIFQVSMSPKDALDADTMGKLSLHVQQVCGQRAIEITSCKSRCHHGVRTRTSFSLHIPTAGQNFQALWKKSIKTVSCCLLDSLHAWVAFGCEKDVILANFEDGHDLAVFQAHNGPVAMIYPVGESSWILSFGEDQTFAVWDVSTLDLAFHSLPMSRSAAVTCIATEVIDKRSSSSGSTIHRAVFGFENASIQVWENRTEFGHIRWELAVNTNFTNHAILAAQQNDSSTSTSPSFVSPSVRAMVFLDSEQDEETCRNSMFDCSAFRDMIAPGSLLIAATCSALRVIETKSWTIADSIDISELVHNSNLQRNTIVSDVALETEGERLYLALKDVFGCCWAIITVRINFKAKFIHCCEDPPDGTPSVVQKKKLNTRSCIAIGLRKQAAIADSVESQLSSLRLGPLQRKVRSSGYGECPPDTMFKPKTNRKYSGSRHESARSFIQKSPFDITTEYPNKSSPSNGGTRATWNKPQQQPSKITKSSAKQEIRSCEWNEHLETANSLQIPTKSIRRIESCVGKSQTAIITGDKRVLVYHDLADPKKNESLTPISGHQSDITDMNFSQCGQLILTGGLDGKLLAHRWNEYQIICSHEAAENADSKRRNVTCAKFFYKDKFVVSSFGYKIQLLSHQQPKKRQTLVPGPSKMVLHEEISMDFHEVTALGARNDIYSHVVLCAGSDRSIHVVDLNVNQTLLEVRDAHKRPIAGLKMFPDTTHSALPAAAYDLFFTSALTDGVKLWDLRETSRCITQFCSHPCRMFASGFAISRCGMYIVASSDSPMAYVYDLRFTGAPVCKIEPKATTSQPIIDVSFQYSNGSRCLTTASIHGDLATFRL